MTTAQMTVKPMSLGTIAPAFGGGPSVTDGSTVIPSRRDPLLPSIPMRSRIRFVLALSLAAVLGGWLLYVSIGGATETYTSPSQLTSSSMTDETYRLNGLHVGEVPDDVAAQARSDAGYTFRVADKDAPGRTVTVIYRGTIPDQLKDGREIIVTGALDARGDFVAKRDSLLALCPSKFTAAPGTSTEH